MCWGLWQQALRSNSGQMPVGNPVGRGLGGRKSPQSDNHRFIRLHFRFHTSWQSCPDTGLRQGFCKLRRARLHASSRKTESIRHMPSVSNPQSSSNLRQARFRFVGSEFPSVARQYSQPESPTLHDPGRSRLAGQSSWRRYRAATGGGIGRIEAAAADRRCWTPGC